MVARICSSSWFAPSRPPARKRSVHECFRLSSSVYSYARRFVERSKPVNRPSINVCLLLLIESPGVVKRAPRVFKATQPQSPSPQWPPPSDDSYGLELNRKQARPAPPNWGQGETPTRDGSSWLATFSEREDLITHSGSTARAGIWKWLRQSCWSSRKLRFGDGVHGSSFNILKPREQRFGPI